MFQQTLFGIAVPGKYNFIKSIYIELQKHGPSFKLTKRTSTHAGEETYGERVAGEE